MTAKKDLDRGVATSHYSPLRIAKVDAPGGGVIGMTLCPGKMGPGNRHPWRRDLEGDLDALDAWGTRCLITLMEFHELIAYQVQELGERAHARFGGSGWLHLPIVDCATPDAAWEAQWAPDIHANTALCDLHLLEQKLPDDLEAAGLRYSDSASRRNPILCT